jgi:hypothetical protein
MNLRVWETRLHFYVAPVYKSPKLDNPWFSDHKGAAEWILTKRRNSLWPLKSSGSGYGKSSCNFRRVYALR